MQRYNKNVFITILFLHVLIARLCAVNIGSDSVVTRLTSQVELRDGDRIAKFANLQGGFFLSDASVTATFDSVFPVSGTIAFNGGVLNLNTDLILNEEAHISNLGNINGQEHTFELAVSTSCIPLNADLCDLVLRDSVSAAADAFRTDWSFDDQFVALGLAGGGHDQLVLYKLVNGELVFQDSVSPAGSREVGGLSWHPFRHILSITTQSGVSAISELTNYEVDVIAGTLTSLQSISLASSNALGLRWHPTGRFIAVGLNQTASQLRIFAYDTTTSTFNTTPIITENVGTSVADVDWDVTGSYIALAGVVSATQAEFRVYDFDEISVTENASVELSRTLLGVSWNRTHTDILAIAMIAGAGVDFLSVYQHDAGNGTLVEKVSVAESGVAITAMSTQWHPNDVCLAVGLSGVSAGPEFRIYDFDHTDFSLTQVFSLEFGDTVDALRWSHDGAYIALGDYIANFSIYKDLSIACNLFSDINLILNEDTSLKDRCIIFDGTSILNGRGNSLTLTSSAELNVAEEATLLIKNITLQGIEANKIRCFDSLSTITFNNATLILDNDYSFTQGHFDVENQVVIDTNGNTLTYSAEQIGSILANSILLFSGGTLSYEPSIADKQLLQLSTDTATLALDGTTLRLTTTGLQLLRGILQVNKTCPVISDATVPAEGLEFGDGLSSNNNLTVKVLPESGLDVQSGFVVSKNI